MPDFRLSVFVVRHTPNCRMANYRGIHTSLFTVGEMDTPIICYANSGNDEIGSKDEERTAKAEQLPQLRDRIIQRGFVFHGEMFELPLIVFDDLDDDFDNVGVIVILLGHNAV